MGVDHRQGSGSTTSSWFRREGPGRSYENSANIVLQCQVGAGVPGSFYISLSAGSTVESVSLEPSAVLLKRTTPNPGNPWYPGFPEFLLCSNTAMLCSCGQAVRSFDAPADIPHGGTPQTKTCKGDRASSKGKQNFPARGRFGQSWPPASPSGTTLLVCSLMLQNVSVQICG